MQSSILWYRHGLRIHDNPALLKALESKTVFYPVYIFDGETTGVSHIGYNRMQFLVESLNDLNNRFKAVGSRLFVFRGSPVQIFRRFWEEFGLKRICFEQDCEPIWHKRDETVKDFCKKHRIEYVECVSHTLWDPFEVIRANGGTPPLTYQMFLHMVSTIGEPSRPVSDADWSNVKFGKIPIELGVEMNLLEKVPTPYDFGLHPENPNSDRMIQWIGGETQALLNLEKRLDVEAKAFCDGYYLPNQANPDLLGPPTSLSAALRHGCLSVRLFYWKIHDLYQNIHRNYLPPTPHITGQLIWREYFYTMSVLNPYYAEMRRNEICLNIPWDEGKQAMENLKRWERGQTGFPFIDAIMRQLLLEGWVHHVARNASACFLTRGDLWISWEKGLNYFLKYLLDADWSVCAGNWMWVSSSAFEQLLDCSQCICPVNFGRRLDPDGEYIKRYVPELRQLPIEYLYEPWCAPLEVQERANCVIGRDYPERIVDHKQASTYNKSQMERIRSSLRERPAHCCPSNEEETRQFMWLSDSCKFHNSFENITELETI